MWPETNIVIEVISTYRKKGRRNVPLCKFSFFLTKLLFEYIVQLGIIRCPRGNEAVVRMKETCSKVQSYITHYFYYMNII